MSRTLLLGAFLLVSLRLVAQAPSAVASDPDADATHPAAMESFQLPSHGALLNALMYEAAGAGAHGTVVLLHGFPGNEKNLDLAQAIRRDGWNVLYFNYRGSWGSPGAFSFQHSIEDAQSALAYLRDPVNAAHLHVDPARLVVIGHSMGGMIALYVAAHDDKVLAVGAISAADMAGFGLVPAGAKAGTRGQQTQGLADRLALEGIAPLAGCTAVGLAAELIAHPEWALANDAPGLKTKTMLIVTSDDGLAASADALAAAVTAEGNQRVKTVHLATDHAYSDKRIALETEMIGEVDSLAAK